jgi:predicted DNA-binding protein
MSTAKIVTKSIRLDDNESEKLKQISQDEGVSEAALLKRFVRRGIAEHRLEKAITAYERGEADLSAAAQYANISVYHMMSELAKRDIEPPPSAEKFMDGLKTLVATFGGSEALKQTISTFESE